MSASVDVTGVSGASIGIEQAGQWQLIWWRFVRHRIAVAGGVIILLFYIIALLADFISPALPEKVSTRHTFAPPQGLHLFYRNPDGSLGFGLHVYDYKVTIDRVAVRRIFVVDETKRIDAGLFVRSEPYLLLGLIPMEHRLIGPLDRTKPFYLLGADRLGRDVLSRILHGARVSLSIGLVGVLMSLTLGVLLGGISGYYGGAVDDLIQRLVELIRSIPSIPLWMGLAAAVPQDWSPLAVYFIITLIVSLVGWTDLARQVRGLVMSIKGEDFVLAARLDGATGGRIILRHMIPSFTSHIIATTTLAIPTMILVETALSFLGIGLRPPIISWGTLLQEAQNVRTVAMAPWLLWPAGAVVLTVLAFNFFGDGLRDAADPYAHTEKGG